MRKGQTSIFIIFSLVILIGFGLVFYLNNQNKIKGETGQQINSVNLIIPIKNYVNTCLRETGEDALQIIGLQGGFHKETASGSAFCSFASGRDWQTPQEHRLLWLGGLGALQIAGGLL